jgi:hypothetical protein
MIQPGVDVGKSKTDVCLLAEGPGVGKKLRCFLTDRTWLGS